MSKLALQKLGQRIRTLRRAQSLSQENLAERTHLHRTYIGGVERGERNIGFLNLVRLAQALEIPLSELLKDVADDFPI